MVTRCFIFSTGTLFFFTFLCLLYFEVYMKQSLNLDKLSISKMELSEANAIGKVAFCWLTILYTKYPTMNFLRFLLFSTCYRSLTNSRWLREVLGGSCLFLVVPDNFGSFLLLVCKLFVPDIKKYLKTLSAFFLWCYGTLLQEICQLYA